VAGKMIKFEAEKLFLRVFQQPAKETLDIESGSE